MQLIQTLRARSDRALPAMLMTRDVSAQLEASAHSQGVRVLHKPVRPLVLRDQVLEIMEQAQSAQ